MLPVWLFSASTFFNQPANDPKIALVFGAGVFCRPSRFVDNPQNINQNTTTNQEIPYDCSPSEVLQQRLNGAIALYQNGQVEKIIVSGDNRKADYNEPFGMFRYLKDNGILEEDIVQDFAGFSTSETCWRAKNVFKVTSVFVVTQPFHIPRATALCQSYGLQVRAVPVFNTDYAGTSFFGFLREIPASWNALTNLFSNPGAVGADGEESLELKQ